MSYCTEWFCIEVVGFKGHENVKALHKTTLEITKEDYLTPRGDCIIGISANKSLRDFSSKFKELIRSKDSILYVLFISELGSMDIIKCRGDPKLTYDDDTRIIIRKSDYIAGNTACINSEKSAKDINRSLVYDLKRGCKGVALFIVIRKPQA